MRRPLAALLAAILVTGLLPLPAMADAPPVATPQAVTTAEDTALAITLAGSDPDGDPLTFAVTGGPDHGTLAGTAPDLVYTPAGDWSGTDTVTFTASDGTATSAPATVAIEVTAVNDPPVAVNDPGVGCGSGGTTGGSFPIPEDWAGGGVGFEGWFALTGSCAPMANDADPDGDTMTLQLVDPQAGHGAVTVLPDGIAYDPDPDYSTPPGDQPGGTWVSDVITYRLFDGTAYSSPASYRIWVVPVNDAPSFTAGSDVGPIFEGSGPYHEPWATGITAGPAEADQAVEFVVESVTNAPMFKTLPAISPTGVLTFEPTRDGYGLSQVTVHLVDDGGLEDYGIPGVAPADSSPSVTFSIAVTAVNDAPALAPIGSKAVAELVPLAFTATAGDGDGNPLTFSLAGGSAGSVPAGASIDPGTGAFTWIPSEGQGPGTYTFDVVVSDGALTDAETIAVTVSEVNTAPLLTPVGPQVVAENAVGQVSLSASDPDIPAQALTFSLAAGAPAWASLIGDTLRLAPAFGDASASVGVCVSDGVAGPVCQAVQVSVGDVNQPPIATPQALTTAEDTALAITLAGSDPDGDPLTFAVTGGPDHGTLAGTAPDLVYTPAGDWSGTDTFTFTASDGTATSAPATVAIDVTAVNDPPVARTDGLTITATSTTTIAVLAGNATTGAGRDFSGPPVDGTSSEPGDTIRVTSVTQGLKGSVSIAPDGGAVIYDPRGCATGGDLFTYTITDRGGLTATASVIVTLARPGTQGLPIAPITDTPTLGFITSSTIGGTVPARLAWCAVTRSGTSARSYRISESRNGGSTYPGSLVMSTRSTTSTRSLAPGVGYRWRVRTLDGAGRTGAWRSSAASRVARLQESSAALVYSPTGWARIIAGGASGGAMRRASSPGAWVRLTVTNVRQVAIVGPRSSTRGSLRVYVDGAPVKVVSERSATSAWRRVLYVRSLASGPGVSHTIELRPVGNGRIDLDTILVLQ